MVPKDVDKAFSDSEIREWVGRLDGLITLGSSLTDYYISKGVPKSKLHTTFHYVDEYYRHKPKRCNSTIKILIQGNMCRDMETVDYIVENCPNIQFVICQGLCDYSSRYTQSNVVLKPYLPEPELRDLMSECQISLNCMKDTIGSNVIATSLGMGMAMVCSNVGSIRDYCNQDNAILCNSKYDFVEALNILVKDDERRYRMQINSYEKSERLLLNNFAHDLKQILLT